MNAPRRHFGKDQKVAILKRRLVDKVLMSDLCGEYDLKLNQIHGRQQILFEHTEAAFEQAGGSRVGETDTGIVERRAANSTPYTHTAPPDLADVLAATPFAATIEG